MHDLGEGDTNAKGRRLHTVRPGVSMSPGENGGGRADLHVRCATPFIGSKLLRLLRLREATVHGTFGRDVRRSHHEHTANPLTIRRIHRARGAGVQCQPH